MNELSVSETKTRIAPNMVLAIRVDGSHFKSFTRDFVRPYDLDFMSAMDDAAIALCKEASGVLFAFVQSDEITLFVTDLQKEQSEYWLGGRAEKIASTSAGIASASLARSYADSPKMPFFDGRVIPLADALGVADYLSSRKRDATSNAIGMTVNALFAEKVVKSLPLSARVELLEGTNMPVSSLPEGFLYGRIVTREEVVVKSVYLGEERTAIRRKWISSVASDSNVDAALSRIPARSN